MRAGSRREGTRGVCVWGGGGTTEAVWGFVGATPPPSPLWWWGRPITALPALGGGLQALRRPHGGRPGAAEAPRREAGGRQGAMAAPQSAAGPRGRRRKPGAAWRRMALRVGFEVILGWVGDKERAGGLGGCGATQREGWPWSCRLPAPLLQDPSLQRSPLLPTSPLLFALFHSNPCICFSFFIFFFNIIASLRRDASHPCCWRRQCRWLYSYSPVVPRPC